MARILLATSLVSIGRVGARAAMFALERLGHEVWFVPTVTLPYHPGHGPGTRIAAPSEVFESFVADIARRPDLGMVDAVMTGYLADAHQARALADLIDAVRLKNPEATILCDPVIGDETGLYVPEAVATAQRDVLLPKAMIATPNRFELDWLCGGSLGSNEAIARAARALGPPRLLVTSSFALMRGKSASLLVSGRQAFLAEADAATPAPHGPGDLFAALFLAHLLAGRPEQDALTRAAASVHEIVVAAARAGLDELPLVAHQNSLTSSRMPVSLRRIVEPA